MVDEIKFYLFNFSNKVKRIIFGVGLVKETEKSVIQCKKMEIFMTVIVL